MYHYRIIIVVASLFINIFPVFCQFFDDFSDDSTGLKGWSGDTGSFRYTSSSAVPLEQRPALQLYTTGSGTSVIFAPQPWNNMMEWSAWFKISFNPSASNHARFYLIGSTNFPATTNGAFFIGIGFLDDRVGLYHELNGQQIIPLITDTTNIYNQSTNQLRIRVVLKNNMWFLWTDPSGGNNLALVDSVFYSVTPGMAVAGVVCCYTSSNSTKFYIDDVFCGAFTIDTVPPSFRQILLKEPMHFSLRFSEPLHETISQSLSSFMICNPVGKPLLCVPDKSDPLMLHLYYPYPFPDGQQLILTLSGIADRAGNVMDDTIVHFTWYSAKRNEILITEIMADPAPSVKLPESEYLEIYNASPYSISLCGWSLWVDNTRHSLPCRMLMPGEYLLIVNEKDTTLWAGYPEVTGLPGFQLKNEGACLALQDYYECLLHAVCYMVSWHSTSFQAEGGFSLELKDITNPCDQSGTWASCKSVEGGTPAATNSHTDPFPDIRAPEILRVSVVNDMNIMVTFSEPADTLRNILKLFSIEELPAIISDYSLITPLYNQVRLILSESLSPEKIYYLLQTDTLMDCRGNFSAGARLPFGIPSPPDRADIVFNEIMFNPVDYGEEYIEFYNSSAKLIDISMCMLAEIDTVQNAIINLYPLTDEATLLFPDDYAVITRDVNRLLSNHPFADPKKVHYSPRLPSLSDQGADFVITGHNGIWLDRIGYSKTFHAPGISETDGIALERLSPFLPGNKRENWYSASAASGWATPTRKNSQGPSSSIAAGKVRVEPSWFTPTGITNNNLTYVYLDELPSGSKAGIIIFDENGQAVRNLLPESVVASGDVIPWDGTTNNGSVCPGGIYLVIVFLCQEKAGFKKYKIPVVIIN